MKSALNPLTKACREAALLLAGAGILVSAPVFAQGSGGLEEVVVTAQHREQNLQDIPISVTAIGAQDLNEAQIFGASEIAFRVPGMSYAEFAPGQSLISMRGINSADDGAGMDNSVVMFLDGVYIGRLANINFEMFDLERIEVLRGPQGTLFGRNAIGGAINVTTAKPTDELTAKVDLSAGNEGMLRYQGLVSGPITENLSGKLTYSHREHDGYVDNVVLNKDQQDEDTDSYRGQLLWSTDNSSWLLSADYMEDDREDMGRVPIANGGADPEPIATWQRLAGDFGKVAAPADGHSYREASGVSLQGDIEFDSGTLTTITAMRDAETDWAMASIGAPFGGGSIEVIDDIVEDIETFTQEFRWTSSLDGSFNYVAGLFYLVEETDRQEQFFVAAPAGPGGSYINVGNEFAIQENETTSYAAYIQGDWDFAEDWTLTVGARYTYDEKETKSESVNCANPGAEVYPECDGQGSSLGIINQNFIVDAEDDWNDFSPKASLQWRQTDDVMWFATIAKGFKSGGFGGAPGTPEQAEVALDEETAWNYEIGMKGDFFDNSLRLNVTGFYTDYEDLQVVRFGPTADAPDFGQFVTKNIGEAEIIGLEAELFWYPTENFYLSATYAYLDTEVDDLIFDAAGGPIDVSGSDLRQAPENSGSLTAGYSWPLNNGSEINLRGDVIYSDEQINDFVDQRTVIEEYTLLNLRAAWRSSDENWEFAVWGKNLTEEEYIQHSYVIGPGVIGTWGPPRTYGATVTWQM